MRAIDRAGAGQMLASARPFDKLRMSGGRAWVLGDDEGMECEWANPRSLAEPRDEMPGAGWGGEHSRRSCGGIVGVWRAYPLDPSTALRMSGAGPWVGSLDSRPPKADFQCLGTRMTEGMGRVVIYCSLVETICTRAHKARRRSPMVGEW